MNVRKIRTDSKLKTLPEERQAAIIEFLREHSLADTRAWLRADGLSTSSTALSDFLSWYRLRRQFQEDESTTETLLEQLKAQIPDLTEEQLDELGQRTFSLLAIRDKDLSGFVQVRSARARGQIEKAKIQLREAAEARLREGLELAQERFRRETVELYVEWSADERSKTILALPISNKQKIEELGRYHFGELWELGSSGEGRVEYGEK